MIGSKMNAPFASEQPSPSARERLQVVEAVAAATMIGAVTMARMVTDPDLSAEILREAEKSLMAARS
jgi:hypothetical protein